MTRFYARQGGIDPFLLFMRIGVRFKFLKLPATIQFSCDEASEC